MASGYKTLALPKKTKDAYKGSHFGVVKQSRTLDYTDANPCDGEVARRNKQNSKGQHLMQS